MPEPNQRPQRTDTSIDYFSTEAASAKISAYFHYLKIKQFSHSISVLSVLKNLRNIMYSRRSYAICVGQFSLLKYSCWIALTALFKCVTSFCLWPGHVCHVGILDKYILCVKSWSLHSHFLRNDDHTVCVILRCCTKRGSDCSTIKSNSMVLNCDISAVTI